MQPVQISFRDVPNIDTLEDSLIKKVEKLNLYCDRIQQCRIVISLDQKRKRHGQHYCVQIDLYVPGQHLAATNRPAENIRAAIRESFEAARRQLEHYNKNKTPRSHLKNGHDIE